MITNKPQLPAYDPKYGGTDQTILYDNLSNKIQIIPNASIPINPAHGTIYIPSPSFVPQNEKNVILPCKCCKKTIDCNTRTLVVITIGQYNITTYLCAECSSDFKDKIENELGEV